MDAATELICVRCHRPVSVNKEYYYEVFEKMHALCFHLEYEHETDPDEPCNVHSCPWWHMGVLKKKLVQLGYDPDEVIKEAIDEEWST